MEGEQQLCSEVLNATSGSVLPSQTAKKPDSKYFQLKRKFLASR